MNSLNNFTLIKTPSSLLTGVATYDHVLRAFNGSFTVEAIRDYLDKAKVEGKRPATLSLIRSAFKKVAKLRAFDVRARAQIDELFKVEFKAPKVDRKIYTEEIPSAAQVSAMIENSSARVGSLIRFLASTGLRISEALSIRLDKVEKRGEFVFISIIGKGNKERRIFYPAAEFKDLKAVYNSKVFLFEAVAGGQFTRAYAWRAIREAGSRVGFMRLHPHSLRHYFATLNIVEKKKETSAVSRYLGHASTSTTLDMYTHSELKPADLFGTV